MAAIHALQHRIRQNIAAALLGIVLIAASDIAIASSPVVVPLKLRGHLPILVAKIEGIAVPLLLDLGDQSTVVLQQSVLDRIKAVPTGEFSRLSDLKGNVIESPMYRVPRLQIGHAEFTDVIARLDVHDPSYQPAKLGQKGFLGTALFKSYEVVLDYSRRTMTLMPRVNTGSPSGSCRGTAVPFSSEWHGEPVTELDTDLGRVTVWWDTGAPASALSKRFAQQARPQLSEDTLTTRRFTLAGTDFGPRPLQIWDMSLPSGFDGFIGYDFFARHVVCVDFPDKQILVRAEQPLGKH